ncbi:MAG: hypothetical protein PVF96_07010 [Candidatus Bathyarchaeota archaeon]|jgi:hypothetical protein
MNRITQNEQAVSNVIVVMLSLVLVVVIAANVILWSYQMNQLDWERMQEDLGILNVAPVNNSSWFTTQREYSLNAGVLANGTYVGTQKTDNVSETFSESLSSTQETLNPNAVGQYAEWNVENPSGSPHWDCCDDDPSDDDSSYVQNNANSWKKEAYAMEGHNGSGSINWVQIFVRARVVQEGSSLIKTLIRTYGTDYESNDFNLTTAYQNFFAHYDTNPNTGVEWIWSEINSLEAGASSRVIGGGVNVRMTSVWIVVDYSSFDDYKVDLNGTFKIELKDYPLSDIKTVEIQLKYRASDIWENFLLEAYNWSSSSYENSGFNNTLGHTPTTGWDTFSVNLTDKWRSYIDVNGVIFVKFRDRNFENNQTIVEIDFLAVRTVINGAMFTIKNMGSMTCHLVSMWVNNSTHHLRYNIDLFINAGNTLTFIRSDISLPKDDYIVKFVTERGNISIYS